MEKAIYETPIVEILEVEVEKGFQTTGSGSGEGTTGGGIFGPNL